jgi:transposase
MRAYSLDLRQRVLASGDRGQGTKAVATKYAVSPAWVRRLKQRRREAGEIGPRQLGQPKGGRLAAHRERLRALNAERPDATLVELREAPGGPVSIWTIWRALRDLKLSFKKNRCTPPSQTGPTSRPGGRNGGSGNWAATRANLSSSTKPGRRRT